MSDAREDLRDAVRRGLNSAGAIGDPDQIEDYVDGVVDALMATTRDERGWFILGGLGHVYVVEHARMTNADPTDHSYWDVRTRNDR